MKSINLKRISNLQVTDFDFVLNQGMKRWDNFSGKNCAILYKKTGQYVDHDFIARETDPRYAGAWGSLEGATAFIAAHFAAQTLGTLGGNKTKKIYGKKQMTEWGKKGGRPKEGGKK